MAVPGWVEFIGHTGLETSVPPATLKLYVHARLRTEFGAATTYVETEPAGETAA